MPGACLHPVRAPPWDSALPPQGPETFGHLVGSGGAASKAGLLLFLPLHAHWQLSSQQQTQAGGRVDGVGGRYGNALWVAVKVQHKKAGECLSSVLGRRETQAQ